MSQYLWLIGGTSESVKIAELISQANIPCLTSITTNEALKLYAHISGLIFWVGTIDTKQIISFLKQYQIQLVVDASHPYAVQISQATIQACHTTNICYFRYERPSIKKYVPLVTHFSSLEQLLKSNQLKNKRVLLTIGCKSLHLFKNYHHQAKFFARILPYPESLKMATKAGFKGDRLIAMRPPFSFEWEKALWQLWQISLVVSKASGILGGEDLKVKVAQALNIRLIIINRPKINYPFVTSNWQILIDVIKQHWNKLN